MSAMPDNFEDVRKQVVARLRDRRDEIGQAIFAHIEEAVPDSASDQDSEYRAGVFLAVASVLDYCLEAVEHGPTWSEPVPSGAALQARRAARAGVSLGTVLRRYVAGHGKLGEFVADEAEGLGLSSNGPALHHLRRAQETVLERITAAIEYEYDQERKLLESSSDQRRKEIVQKMLSGESVDPADRADLQYEFHTAWHLGVIAIGADAERTMQHLKSSLNRGLLLVAYSDEIVWAWLGGKRKLTITEVERSLSPNCRALLVVGEPEQGLDGWHLTHHQARQTLQVAMHKPETLTRYADSVLLAALIHNKTLAQSLRQKYLVPLRGHRDTSTLYRTLRAYIDSGCNATSAGHVLGVRRHTVESRRRTVEKLLGFPLTRRLSELDMALRLEELDSAID